MRHLVMCVLLMGITAGCTKTDKLTALGQVFDSPVPVQQVNVNFCSDPAITPKQYLKTIIVLDHSGSNKDNYQMNSDGSGAPALVNGTIVANATYATDPT